MTLRIGVDVGGTSIDAVCLAPGNAVLGWSKRPAPKSAGEPEQLIAGVVAAVEAALAEAQRGACYPQPWLQLVGEHAWGSLPANRCSSAS